MTEEQFLFAAFIHDLGKLLERSKSLELSEEIAAADVYGHAKYSAQLVRAIRLSGEKTNGGYDLTSTYLGKVCCEEVEKVVLFHHRPRTVEGIIIQLADWLQSSEREESPKTRSQYYLDVPLASPVQGVDSKAEERFYSIAPLTIDGIMPHKKEEARRGIEAYEELTKSFLGDLRLIKDFEQFISLCEIYLSQVPAQTVGYVSDISLFDHSRLVAALAHSLYRDYSRGLLKDSDLKDCIGWMRRDANDRYYPPVFDQNLFWFLKMDFSGIQNFIFNVTSKQAARMLKGRSVYLDLLARYVVKHLLQEVGVTSVNIIYLGGGNAEVLLPLVDEVVLEEVRCRVSKILWEAHHGEIYLAMEWLPLAFEDLFNFVEKRDELQERLNLRKRRRFVELGEEEFYQYLFIPEDEETREGESCSICYRKGKSATYEGERRCEVCQSFVGLTNELKKSRYLVEKEIESIEKTPKGVYDVFECLGFSIRFVEDWEEELTNGKVYVLEKITLNLDDNKDKEKKLADGFLLGSFRNLISDFEELARGEIEESSDDEKFTMGDVRLGYLKMDVDNLGRIFAEINRLERERGSESRKLALSRYRAFSRRIELFFGGYVVSLVTPTKGSSPGQKFYPVFSGGDDLFIIGRWDDIVVLASEIRDKFAEYTGYSERVTLSGGIAFFPYNFPMIRASHLVEEELERAKNWFYPEDLSNPSWLFKNKVGILGEVLTWEEYKKMRELSEDLAEKVKDGEVSRAIFKKIERSLRGLTPIIEESLRGIVSPPRIWRFLYYLRDYKELAQEIEQIVLDNLFGEVRVRNPRLVLVASKIATMATRKIKENKQKL